MNPLTGLYGAGIALRNTLFDRGVLPALRLDEPVISVGNLSAGGSGKTPFVITLGELLRERGVHFDVLSRDEPVLIARRLGVPVIVGESRYQAGQLAEQKFQTQLHLLDDGFQHRALARDFDIVLLAPGDLEDRLLPSGRLREPLSSLQRADAIVLPRDLAAGHPALRGKPVWRMTREIEITGIHIKNVLWEGTALAVPLAPPESGGFSPGAPPSPIVFCGIARPQQFFAQVRAAGVSPVAEIAFRDHHAYDTSDIQRLVAMRRESGADGFLTTEKDAINLGPLRADLEPLAVATLKLTLGRPADLVDTILARIAERKPRS
jgi:tetraacyldisaccharide 4'-kinase